MNRYDKRPFLQWFVLALAYSVAAWFSWKLGVLNTIWHVDFTYITSMIGGVFVATVLWLGYHTWIYDPTNTRRAQAAAGIASTSGFIVTMLGLLGTAVGMRYQVAEMGHVDVANPANTLIFITQISSALGTGIWSTICGLVACVGITVVNSNLLYFVDQDHNEEAFLAQELLNKLANGGGSE